MTSMAFARDAIARKFSNVREVEAQVLRGESFHDDKCYAVAYVDLADDVVDRSNHLREFQERVLGEDFFDLPDELRWNNYLYLIAGPNSIATEGFEDAKAVIEADKDFARKRVVSAAEFVDMLGDSKLFSLEGASVQSDIVGNWEERLREAGLDSLIEMPVPRTEVIARIGRKEAARPAAPTKAKPLSDVDKSLGRSHLRRLEVTRFRPVHDGKTYGFGSVTLIVGPNGSGKTSLLKAIEYLYCGLNRRPTGAGSLKVKGHFSTLDTGKSFDCASITETARIKARCVEWYRRSEFQAKAILDGFTRFNFLDTDAAVRLSTELPPGDISKDLSRLLIGAEASLLWDYLGKVSDDLDTAWTRASDQLSSERVRSKLLEAEVARLKAVPSEASSLTRTYREALVAAGWEGAAANDPAPVQATERLQLVEVVVLLDEILASGAAGASTLQGILTRIDEIDSAISNAEGIEVRRETAFNEVKTHGDAIALIDKQLDLLATWLTFSTAKFSEALQSEKRAEELIAGARNRVGRLIGMKVPSFDVELGKESLTAALARTREAAGASENTSASLEQQVQDFGQIQAAQAESAQQLKDAALAMIQQGHSARECPVCGTEHLPAELLQKIEAITTRTASPEPLRKAQAELEKSRREAKSLQERVKTLEVVGRVAAQLGIAPSATIEEILRGFQDATAAVHNASEVYSLALAQLRALEDGGLTKSDYAEVKASVQQLFPAEVDFTQVDEIEKLRTIRAGQRTSSDAELKAHREAYEHATAEISSIVEGLRSKEWPATTSRERGFSALQENRAKVQALYKKALKVQERIALTNQKKFSELHQSMSGLVAMLDRALHASAADASASEELSTKESDLKKLLARISNLDGISRNHRAALDVLQALRSEASLEGATHDALDAIRGQINDVFGRIHMPREYEYSESAGCLLQTRDGKNQRTLEEVSTGQRAAFALSIFLALNLTAKSAPPLVLIDDPIAHIDDLNALSFLDYLRDLAVHSKRQIFFATADTRIAALFEKKFSFLGEDSFRKIVLERRAEPAPAA